MNCSRRVNLGEEAPEYKQEQRSHSLKLINQVDSDRLAKNSSGNITGTGDATKSAILRVMIICKPAARAASLVTASSKSFTELCNADRITSSVTLAT